MPLGLLVDHFFQKGEYTPEQLKVKMKELIANSPIRPHIGKADKAPLWIPRKNAEYIVVTCPECLRSSSIADQTEAGDLKEIECIACGANISYLVDSSVLKILNDARPKRSAT
jgi:ribosomal protein S27E